MSTKNFQNEPNGNRRCTCEDSLALILHEIPHFGSVVEMESPLALVIAITYLAYIAG